MKASVVSEEDILARNLAAFERIKFVVDDDEVDCEKEKASTIPEADDTPTDV